MASGDYILSIVAKDYAGNETIQKFNFTIKNTSVDLSSLADSSWSTTTGQPLKDDRTVYLWHLDENSDEVNDENASLDGYTSTTGGFGDGFASYIHTSDTIPLDVSSNEFTLEYWVKGSQVGNNPYIYISKSNSFYCYYDYMYLDYQNSDSDVSSTYIYYSTVPADSEWHYVSIVYGKSYVAQYIDGILTSCKDGLSLTLYNNDNKLCMYSNYIDAVDEIRISNASRSADEIKAYYDCAKEFLQ